MKQVKVQIPLSQSLRDAVEAHAVKLGFNSVQDFTRVMYATVLQDDLTLSLVQPGERGGAQMSSAAEQRYTKQLATLPERIESGEAKVFASEVEAKAFLANL